MPVPRANEKVGVKRVEAAVPAAIKIKRVGDYTSTKELCGHRKPVIVLA